MRFALLGRHRVGPYVLAGLAAGVSRPNVTPIFPTPVTNEVVASFFGGGMLFPLGDKVAVFADARMMLAAGTESDELIAVVPIRGGIAWHSSSRGRASHTVAEALGGRPLLRDVSKTRH
jgi:hypothetical protein